MWGRMKIKKNKEESELTMEAQFNNWHAMEENSIFNKSDHF